MYAVCVCGCACVAWEEGRNRIRTFYKSWMAIKVERVDAWEQDTAPTRTDFFHCGIKNKWIELLSMGHLQPTADTPTFLCAQ